MTVADADLVERFEQLEIDAGSFKHRDHVETAYAMLQKYPFLEAAARYAKTIHTMATNAGAEAKFHMTVTIAFLALIAERMESSAHRDFDDFAAQHPDLFSRDLLKGFYSSRRLDSALARKIFVMPDASE